jgi:hypothetical protein
VPEIPGWMTSARAMQRRMSAIWFRACQYCAASSIASAAFWL